MIIDKSLKPEHLKDAITRFWELSANKIRAIDKSWDPSSGSPVFTVRGKYTARGWTEWTQGFQYGSALLQYDATGDTFFLDIGRRDTINRMAPHLTHEGVHDHGFNNISTYGNLLRLMKEEKVPYNDREADFYALALKVSGAVQAMRWTSIPGGGYMYSFNGPHSLFVDTIRSCRILMLSEALGHVLMGENDKKISLAQRAIQHLTSTAKYSVYYGEGRDAYDVRGRTAHESIFNVNDGNYRCPNSQQGYSGFTTWTRGLAWAMCGFAEELEFLAAFPAYVSDDIVSTCLKAAKATCDFYIEHTCADGIPYWDTGAPNLHRLDPRYDGPSDPENPYEPVDSSAAAIAAQGLLRLGKYLEKSDKANSEKYFQAGLCVVRTLLQSPYLSDDDRHEGLILHSVYHRPNGWDYIPEGKKVPCGESSMWGDYHAREVMLYLTRLINNEPYYTFFSGIAEGKS
jgi:unsaturated chondroitin disaccharide hydrolase